MDLIPNTAGEWLNTISIIVLGAFSVFSIYSGALNRKRKEADEADDRLINLLKTTVDSLEKKVKELDDKLQSTTIEMMKIRTERDTLVSILQGRDTATLEYQKAGLEAMKAGQVTQEIVRNTNANVEKLYKLIERGFHDLNENIVEIKSN